MRALDKMVHGKDGQSYHLRPIRAADAPSLMRGYDAMSDQAKWFRLLYTVPHLTAETAARFCAPDPAREICVVVEGHGALESEILGGARIAGEADGRSAEFSVSLRPEAQGLGLGRAALETVFDAAKDKDYESVWGLIAHDNRAMLSLAHQMGFTLETDPTNPGVMRAELTL